MSMRSCFERRPFNNKIEDRTDLHTLLAHCILRSEENSMSSSGSRPDKSDQEAVIRYADDLYEKQQWRELLDYLQEMLGPDGDDPQLTWRLLRCAFRLGQRSLLAGNSKEAEEIADMASVKGKRALEKEDRNFNLHKWSGILYRLLGDIKGMKVKIENSHKIREHFQKAEELDPLDPYIKHLLGRWCFQIAGVTWLQRKMASAILASPPTSSYPEALKYFETAEEVKPGAFKANWLWMGKTLLQLKKKGEAKQWLQKLVEAETLGIDDDEAKQEAKDLIRGL